MDPTKTHYSPHSSTGQIFPPEVSEVDILEVLERELRETEVGVDDSSGAGGCVGEDHRVRTDVAGVFWTSSNLHSVLQQALAQPLSVLAPGEGPEIGGAQAEVGEDGAAVVGISAPALVLGHAPLVGVLHGEGGDDGDLVQAHQARTQYWLHPPALHVTSHLSLNIRQLKTGSTCLWLTWDSIKTTFSEVFFS